MMMCDVFTADEFVAACETQTTYDFNCNVDAGLWENIYDPETRFPIVWDGSYHACGSGEHDVTDLSVLKKGYVYNLFEEGLDPIDVYYWVDGNNSIHCTNDVQTVETWLKS